MAIGAADHLIPWRAIDTRICDSGGALIGSVCHPEDASRIVDAVNAVSGIPFALLREQEVQRLINKHEADLEEQVPGLKGLLDEWRRKKAQ